LVEEDSADASAGGGGESGLCAEWGVGVEEADSAEGGTFDRANIDSEFGKGGYGVGHEALAAGLVDGRGHAVGNFYCETVLGGGDGAGEAGGASSYD
jgi:hypothetical protein